MSFDTLVGDTHGGAGAGDDDDSDAGVGAGADTGVDSPLVRGGSSSCLWGVFDLLNGLVLIMLLRLVLLLRLVFLLFLLVLRHVNDIVDVDERDLVLCVSDKGCPTCRLRGSPF